MTTRRNRRVQAAPPPYALDEDGDRIYTEEDYAVAAEPAESAELVEDEAPYLRSMGWTTDASLPDDSFAPDEAEELYPDEWTPAQEEYVPFQGEGYAPMYDSETDYMDDGSPLDDDLLTEEEQHELRRSRWQLISNLADFAGVIAGTAAILVLVMLLVSLLNWLVGDMSQSFILLQKHL